LIGRRLRQLPLALEAAIELIAASLAMARRADHEITALLGAPRASSSSETPAFVERSADSPAAGVGRAVERVARLMPWRPRCLSQAIATRRMLTRRGVPSRGHLGVVGTAPLETHAWVTVDGTVVQGGPLGQVSELCFLE
jgi:hypothetical protein